MGSGSLTDEDVEQMDDMMGSCDLCLPFRTSSGPRLRGPLNYPRTQADAEKRSSVEMEEPWISTASPPRF